VKAKKEAEENKPKIIEQQNGMKFAPLVKDKVDANEPGLALKKAEKVDINITPQIGNITINPPQFINSKMGEFAPLEKSSQQLKE